MIGPKKSRKLIGPEMGIRFFGYFGGSGHIDRPTRKTLKTDRPRNGDKGFAMKYSMKLEPGFNNKLISVEILSLSIRFGHQTGHICNESCQKSLQPPLMVPTSVLHFSCTVQLFY